MVQGTTLSVFFDGVNEKTPDKLESFRGAVDQIRTGDLFLGKEALYQLSYYRSNVVVILVKHGCAVNIKLKIWRLTPHEEFK
jgi:hypothetical protein